MAALPKLTTFSPAHVAKMGEFSKDIEEIDSRVQSHPHADFATEFAKLDILACKIQVFLRFFDRFKPLIREKTNELQKKIDKVVNIWEERVKVSLPKIPEDQLDTLRVSHKKTFSTALEQFLTPNTPEAKGAMNVRLRQFKIAVEEQFDGHRSILTELTSKIENLRSHPNPVAKK